MWTAGRLRAGLEAYFPSVMLSFFIYMSSGNLVTFGWIAILSIAAFFWGIFWPAYRIKRAPRPMLKRIRYWAVFLIIYTSFSYVFDSLLQWIFGLPPIMVENPELFEETSISDLTIYIIAGILLVIAIIGARLFTWLVAIFYEWVSRRLVRQFTLSHIGMLIIVFWLSGLFAFIYMAAWNLPNKVQGIEEVENVAKWTTPLIEEQELSQLEQWLQQVKKKNYRVNWYSTEEEILYEEWRVYDKQGQLLAATKPGSPGSLQEERQLVKQALEWYKVDSQLVNPDTNRYLTVAPIFDSKYKIIGAVVLERDVAQEIHMGLLVVYFLIFLLLSFGGTFVALLLALIIASLFGYMRARQLTRRFQKVALAAEKWSKGELSYRVPIDLPDELGVLSGQLNQVAGSLQEVNAKLAAEKRYVETLLHSRKEWISNISHELRTPVAVIRGHLEAWEAEEDQHKAANRLKILNREVRRLQGMIDELFLLATQDEMNREEEALPLEEVNVKELLKEVHEAFAPIAWNERQISIEKSLEVDDLQIQAHEVRLRQILHNLVRNALRHTPEGGLILLSATVENENICIDVIDTGSGIPAEELPHVFERYYRGRVVDGRYQGSGIGLALVKEWITEMGGRIEITSEVGKGTQVRLIFLRS